MRLRVCSAQPWSCGARPWNSGRNARTLVEAQAARQHQLAGDAAGAGQRTIPAGARLDASWRPATGCGHGHRQNRCATIVAPWYVKRCISCAASPPFYLKRGERFDAAEQLNLAGLTLYNTDDYTAALRDYGRARVLYEGLGSAIVSLSCCRISPWSIGISAGHRPR